MLSKELLWEVRIFFFFVDAVCVYKGDWGGGEAKIRFFFFTRQDRMAEERPQFILVRKV